MGPRAYRPTFRELGSIERTLPTMLRTGHPIVAAEGMRDAICAGRGCWRSLMTTCLTWSLDPSFYKRPGRTLHDAGVVRDRSIPPPTGYLGGCARDAPRATIRLGLPNSSIDQGRKEHAHAAARESLRDRLAETLPTLPCWTPWSRPSSSRSAVRSRSLPGRSRSGRAEVLGGALTPGPGGRRSPGF
jgi:hypothetical protein